MQDVCKQGSTSHYNHVGTDHFEGTDYNGQLPIQKVPGLCKIYERYVFTDIEQSRLFLFTTCGTNVYLSTVSSFVCVCPMKYVESH